MGPTFGITGALVILGCGIMTYLRDPGRWTWWPAYTSTSKAQIQAGLDSRPELELPLFSRPVQALTVLRGNMWIAAADDRGFQVVNTRTWETTLKNERIAPQSLAFWPPNSSHCLTLGRGEGAPTIVGPGGGFMSITNNYLGDDPAAVSDEWRLLTPFESHLDGAPDLLLAGIARDRTITIWRHEKAAPIAQWTWDTASRGIYSLAWDESGKFLAAGDMHGHVRLWEAQSQKVVATLTPPDEDHFWVKGLTFCRGGSHLLVAYRHRVALWNLNSLRVEWTEPVPQTVPGSQGTPPSIVSALPLDAGTDYVVIPVNWFARSWLLVLDIRNKRWMQSGACDKPVTCLAIGGWTEKLVVTGHEGGAVIVWSRPDNGWPD